MAVNDLLILSGRQ